MNEITIFSSTDKLFEAAALDFAHSANKAVAAKGEFTVVLSGGSTPILFFNRLAEIKTNLAIPWQQIKFFFGDERYVPANSPQSNYHMASEHLLSKVPVLAKHIYPMPTLLTHPRDAAQAYELTLRKVFHINKNDFPAFDLVYLGLGEDGHTASLMPFTDIVQSYQDKTINHQLVAALWFAEQEMYRITLTPPAINHATKVMFLVTGKNKAHAVFQVLEGPSQSERYPAQLIQCIENKTIWYLDQSAASQLKQGQSDEK